MLLPARLYNLSNASRTYILRVKLYSVSYIFWSKWDICFLAKIYGKWWLRKYQNVSWFHLLGSSRRDCRAGYHWGSEDRKREWHVGNTYPRRDNRESQNHFSYHYHHFLQGKLDYTNMHYQLPSWSVSWSYLFFFLFPSASSLQSHGFFKAQDV